MGWRERLQPASFRGVGFGVERTESGFGRLVVTHRFPSFGARPRHFHEDLGRDLRRFAIRGWILGDDYFERRDELTAACERRGPGRLVHPYQGTQDVVCIDLRVEQSAAEGGIARVTMTFVESGRVEFARRIVVDPEAGAAAAADAAGDAAEAAFAAELATEGQPGFVLDAAAGAAEQALEVLDAAPLRGAIATTAAYVRGIARLADLLIDRIAEPSAFATDVRGLVRLVRDVVGSRRAALEVYLDVFSLEAELVGGTSPTQQAADRNAQLALGIFQWFAAAEAVRDASGVAWESYDEAVRARDELAEGIDGLLPTAPDRVYLALTDLLSRLAAAVPPPASDLPRLDTFVPASTAPAVAIAYRLYDDAEREADLVARNRVRHPGFVPGGRPLEVLSA